MTPEEFIASAGPREGEVALLDRMVREIAPNLAPEVVGTMLGYGPYHYRYASGREGDSHRVLLSPRRTGITVHLAAGVYAPVEGANAGVGCLKIRDLARVDLDALKREIERAVKADLPNEAPAQPV